MSPAQRAAARASLIGVLRLPGDQKVAGRNSLRRLLAMSEHTEGTAYPGQLKTLAVRITEDLRAQLDIVAQLTGRSATEEIRLALEHWIEKVKSDPVMLKKAATVQAEIARAAQTQRNAIAAIFGDGGPGADASQAEDGANTSPRSSTRRNKPAGE
jgi:predicted DNA-binding protein